MGTTSPLTPSSYRILRSHNASLVAMAAETYSTSVVDVATVDWRLIVHDICLLPRNRPTNEGEDKASLRPTSVNIACPVCVNVPLERLVVAVHDPYARGPAKISEHLRGHAHVVLLGA